MIVGVGHVVCENHRSIGKPNPGDHVQVLDRNRHAEQRRQHRGFGCLCGRALRLACLVTREVRGYSKERTDSSAKPVDPVQIMVEDFHRRQFLAADSLGLLQRCEIMNLRHVTER